MNTDQRYPEINKAGSKLALLWTHDVYSSGWGAGVPGRASKWQSILKGPDNPGRTLEGGPLMGRSGGGRGEERKVRDMPLCLRHAGYLGFSCNCGFQELSLFLSTLWWLLSHRICDYTLGSCSEPESAFKLVSRTCMVNACPVQGLRGSVKHLSIDTMAVNLILLIPLNFFGVQSSTQSKSTLPGVWEAKCQPRSHSLLTFPVQLLYLALATVISPPPVESFGLSSANSQQDLC